MSTVAIFDDAIFDEDIFDTRTKPTKTEIESLLDLIWNRNIHAWLLGVFYFFYGD